MKHVAIVVLVVLLSAGNSWAGSAVNNPPTSGGGGGAVSSVTGAGTVTCTPTTGSVVCTGSATGGALLIVNNLSDVASVATSRTNLGLVAVASSGSATDLTTGTLSSARLPAFTGDATSSAGTAALTLATVNGNVGSFTNASFTVNAKGLITAASSGAAPEVPLTFASGLTRSTNTVTNDLITGKSGGQTIACGTGAGDGCTYSSTTNATKGLHTFGSSTGLVFDESATVLRLGVATAFSGATIAAVKAFAGQEVMWLANTNAGTTSQAGFCAGQSTTGSGASVCLLQNSSGFTTSGAYKANDAVVELAAGASDLVLSVRQAAGDIVLATTASKSERMRVTSAGSVTVGTGLSTSATDGYFYDNSMAGAPTGTPTTLNGGSSIAEVYDRTNDRLDFYNGAWRGIPLASPASSGSQTLLQTNGPAGIGSTTPHWETYKDSAGITSYREFWQ